MGDLETDLKSLTICCHEAYQPVMARIRGVAAALLMLMVLAGCHTGDFRLHVRNDTADTWWLRVAIGGEWGDDQFWVAQVRPGADGPAFDWYGSRDKPVQVLSENCDVVGLFEPNADGTYFVLSIPGLEGTIQPIGPNLGSSRGEEITLDGRCGGTLIM